MALPGFNAETSLYKTSVHYRLTAASVRADGVTIQQISRPLNYCNGPCFWDENGRCSQGCGYCGPFPPFQCHYWTQPCPCVTAEGDCPQAPCFCCGPNNRQICC